MFNLWKTSSKKDKKWKRGSGRYSKGAKAKFTPEEDIELKQLIEVYGTNNWQTIASKMKGRNERQVKDRWFYYLSPDLNKSEWTQEEDNLLISKVQELGSSWVKISKAFNGRTDVQIKNRWNILKRKMTSGTYQKDSSSNEFTIKEEPQSIEKNSEPCLINEESKDQTNAFFQYEALEAIFKNEDLFPSSIFDDGEFAFLF